MEGAAIFYWLVLFYSLVLPNPALLSRFFVYASVFAERLPVTAQAARIGQAGRELSANLSPPLLFARQSKVSS